VGKKLYAVFKNGGRKTITLELERIGPDGKSVPSDDDDRFAIVDIVE
jgi:hypothetical protein